MVEFVPERNYDSKRVVASAQNQEFFTISKTSAVGAAYL
jgi:hypothetical protein